MPLKEPELNHSPYEEPLLRNSGFKKVEDWERLTRLELIVESVARETERQARELSIVIQTQRDMMSHLKTIKYSVVGLLCGLVISQIGLEKATSILLSMIGM